MLVTSMLLAGLFFGVAKSASATTEQSGASDCQTVTTTTTDECAALVALYQATDGPNWAAQNNWLTFTAGAPCNWQGVECIAGHVTGLSLAANSLSGTIPYTIGLLANLTTLDLANNALTGHVPSAICTLVPTMLDANLGYNALVTSSKRATTCLTKLDPDWRATQTVEPRNLRISEFYTSSLRLSWQAIPYTADGGGY
ncbi:MAG: hypothetical protein KDE19_07925, partial [Caldilineaceae bacterium]|nr:hypothetical protein [Caldilineaceae bacterium]